MRSSRERKIGIKKWLLDQGITQAQIAYETGTSATTVSRVISGQRGTRHAGKSLAVIEYLARNGCPHVQTEDTP